MSIRPRVFIWAVVVAGLFAPGLPAVAAAPAAVLVDTDFAKDLVPVLPDNGPANLLRNSRLPLGLANGWFILRGEDHDSDNITVTGDSTVLGPSGAPTLKVEAQSLAEGVIQSEPFRVVDPVVPHMFAVSVRGPGVVTFQVLSNVGFIVEQTFRLANADWKRLEVPFVPQSAGNVYVVYLRVQGAVWFDGFQVGPANRVGEYRSAGDAEVALACPPGKEVPDLAYTRIQFPEDPAEVIYCVTGQIRGAVLKAQVADLYGQMYHLPDVALDGRPIVNGRLAFGVNPARPFGAFRIEAWIERDGKRISPYNELVVNRLPRPKYWLRDAPNSPFSIHMLADTRTILTLKAAGINWTRLHDAGFQYLGWYWLEPQKGQWQFRDKEIQRYRKYGIKVFGDLETTPRWASYLAGSDSKDVKGQKYLDRFSPPKNLEDFKNYVRTVVKRYQGVIDAYDVWNEPWGDFWPMPKGYDNSKRDKDFTALQQAAYEAVMSVDPTVKVAGFNTTPSVRRGWTLGVLKYGGLDACNVVAYHQYSKRPAGYQGDGIEEGYQTAIGPILEKYGGVCPKPVWMTEGQPSFAPSGNAFYHYTLAQPDPVEKDPVATANATVRYQVALLGTGVERIFLYSAHCYSGYRDFSNESFLVLLYSDGFLHPSGVAQAALGRELEDTKIVRRTELPGGIYAYFFRGKGRSVAVLCPKPEAKAVKVPRAAGVTVRDLFGNDLPPEAGVGETVVYVSTPMTPEALEKFLASGLAAGQANASK